MKTFKLTKKMLNHPSVLLSTVGAVVERQAYPGCVYMHPKDYKTLRNNLKKLYKTEYPFLNKRKIDSSVGMCLLNLGPVESVGINPGFVLFDEKEFKSSIQPGV